MNQTPTLVSKTQKDILSRLLATEDIIVEHSKNAPTAMFDVKNRVLVLPMWKEMSTRLYDMLVGHEVGHALFTPMSDASGRDLPEIIKDLAGNAGDEPFVKGLLNVVEDARIERKMKLKFPGMRRDFVAGYKDLHIDRDFFGLENTDISELGLGDRINLHYKIGDQISIPFTAEERKILDTIDVTESFDDVIDVVADLYDAINEEQRQLQSTDAEDADATFSDNHENGELGDNDVQVGTGGANEETSDEAGNSGQSDSDPSDDDSTDENASGDDSEDCGDSMDDDTDDGSSAESDSQNGGGGDDTGASMGCGLSTVDAAEKAMEALREDDKYMPDHKYVEFADYDASDWIVSHEDTYKGLFSPDEAQLKQNLDRKVAKGANLLVKQFEMKKAADAHKRTVISKTGVLDTVKMVNYKFSDDIFRRNATVTEGKNHGLVCFIDWSGSMHNDMDATLEQLYLLATFCKKANIPFDFYSFSSQTPWKGCDEYSYSHVKKEDQLPLPAGPRGARNDEETNKIRPSANMCLYELVSSSMSNRTFNKCMGHLASLHGAFTNEYCSEIRIGAHLHLGGTPLDDCIVLARDIVNEFRRKHGLQIVHGIFLTDGESHGGCVNNSTHIRDNRKNYETRDLKARWGRGSTKKLLEWFRATTDAKAIGIFLTSTPRTAMRYAGVNWDEEKATKKLFTKNKYIAPGEMHGYTEYFILKSDTKVELGNFDEVDSDVSTTRLKSAFIKSQSQSITSRTVLNRIADLIADG